MAKARRPRTLNPGNLLVCLGVVGLGFTFWMPYGTAARVARIERRAEDITRELRDYLGSLLDLDLSDQATAADLVAEINRSRGHEDPESSLHIEVERPAAPEAKGAVFFSGKHYCYMVTRTPEKYLDKGEDIELPGTGEEKTPVPTPEPGDRPMEIYSWPLSFITSGRTVFFYSTDGKAAFMRNLNGQYVGLKKPPLAACGRRRDQREPGFYRGNDDQFWIPLATP